MLVKVCPSRRVTAVDVPVFAGFVVDQRHAAVEPRAVQMPDSSCGMVLPFCPAFGVATCNPVGSTGVWWQPANASRATAAQAAVRAGFIDSLLG